LERPDARLPDRIVRSSGHEHANVSQTFRLLRPCRERPRRRGAAEQRDELAAASHSITWSASASSLSGIWRASAFVVLRLMINSIFVACMTGRLAGFHP
jgi:hypothetical protein